MPSGEDLTFDAAAFGGRVRLFPLPNLVMFPHVLQPLHIFEPRYRALLEESLADDRLIAMAVLAPGWESDYDGRPPLRTSACLGRIVTHQQIEGGRYNVLLAGLKRVQIVRELPPTKLFREAEVNLLDDEYPAADVQLRTTKQHSLIESFERILPNMPEVHQQLQELLGAEVSLGTLTDLVAYTLTMPLPEKCALLEELNVDRRCERLLRYLRTSAGSAVLGTETGPSPKWPPDFSKN